MSGEVKKSIQLTTRALEDFLQAGQSVDFRLDEPQWADIHRGEIVLFWEDFSGWDRVAAPNARQAHALIEDIVRAKTFDDLLNHHDLDTFLRNHNVEDVLQGLRRWWSPDQEAKNGVLGWKIKLIPS